MYKCIPHTESIMKISFHKSLFWFALCVDWYARTRVPIASYLYTPHPSVQSLFTDPVRSHRNNENSLETRYLIAEPICLSVVLHLARNINVVQCQQQRIPAQVWSQIRLIQVFGLIYLQHKAIVKYHSKWVGQYASKRYSTNRRTTTTKKYGEKRTNERKWMKRMRTVKHKK